MAGDRQTNATEAAAATLLMPWCLGVPINRFTAKSPEMLFSDFLLPHVPESKAPFLLVDVGANRGQFALSVVAAGHRSIAFEPSPAACATLKAAVNAAQNRSALSAGGRQRRRRPMGRKAPRSGQGRVDVHCAAVGARPGSVKFSTTERTTTSAHVSATGEAVPVVRLDDVVGGDERGFYLKTDTQGFEGEVLQGADRLLRTAAPRVMLIELSPGTLEQHGSSVRKLIAQVTSYGYDCTFGMFFSAAKKKTRGGRETITSTLVPVPRQLEGKAEVSVEDMEAMLKHMPRTKMGGWTDLLCWAPMLQ